MPLTPDQLGELRALRRRKKHLARRLEQLQLHLHPAAAPPTPALRAWLQDRIADAAAERTTVEQDIAALRQFQR